MIRLLKLLRLVWKDLHLLWFALQHPRRPVWLVPAVLLLCFYVLDPFNFMVPIAGAVDDFVLVPLLLHLMLRLLPLSIRAGFGLPGRTR